VRVAGVDGCPRGWVAAVADWSPRGWTWVGWHVDVGAADLPALADVVAIDIPIGLPEQGRRPLETAVRKRIAPRGSSVFPTPVRAVLEATTYVEACALSRRHCEGKAISLQTWHILDKIREVDLVPGLVEAHPELTLLTMTGRLLPPKRSLSGRLARIEVLGAELGLDVGTLVAQGRRLGSARHDDLLDAVALLWTARRWALGGHEAFDDGVDARGRPMRIVV
jgi:predicted RNase H-like nuclease